ncbi:MAG: O-antigen/teichoic acid export membrane protein [Saprospiraceae bacterium]
MKKYFNKIKNSGLLLIDQGLVSGTSFITGIMLTRFLGLKEYGAFILLWMVILFGLSITQALITQPLVSLEPKMSQEESNPYLRSVHGFQLLLSLLATLLSIIALTLLSQFEFFRSLELLTITGLSLALGLILLYDFYRKYFFLKNDFKTPLGTDAILMIIQLGGIFLLYETGLLSIPYFLSVVAFTYLVVCGIGYIKILRPEFGTKALTTVFQKHYDFSKWLLGTVALQWLGGNFFIICAGGILGAATVGAVRIAQNVIGLTHVIFLAMENVVPISAARAFKDGGRKKLYTFLKNISLKIGWFVMSILILISIFSPNILGLLYGEDFVAYSYILICFCIIYLLVYIGYPLRFALRTLELTKPIFIAYALGAIFSVIMAAPMLQYWGIYGLLLGLFMTQLITQSVYVISLWKIKRYYENHSFDTR